jgi:hypothetical protein
VNELDALTRDYRTAFLRYLPRREEAALTRGYELGRVGVGQVCSRLAPALTEDGRGRD